MRKAIVILAILGVVALAVVLGLSLPNFPSMSAISITLEANPTEGRYPTTVYFTAHIELETTNNRMWLQIMRNGEWGSQQSGVTDNYNNISWNWNPPHGTNMFRAIYIRDNIVYFSNTVTVTAS